MTLYITLVFYMLVEMKIDNIYITKMDMSYIHNQQSLGTSKKLWPSLVHRPVGLCALNIMIFIADRDMQCALITTKHDILLLILKVFPQ